ncbi:MAG: DNA polymerase III subunit beta, partial [Beijerinckiaceae bacterium]
MTLTAHVEQKPLAATLARLASIVESRSTIPALQNIAVTAANDTLTLTVTDLDIEATATIAAQVIAPGATTIPAKMLADIVRKLPAGSLVQLSERDGKATVAAGKSSFSLATLPIEDFPVIASQDYTARMTIPAHDLSRLFSGVFAASTDETRYYLNGVYLHAIDAVLFGVTTDGHKLAHLSMPFTGQVDNVIVPRKAVLEVVKSYVDGPVEVSTSQTKIRFHSPAVTIVSKVIDGTFPDYTRVIPPVSQTYVKFAPELMRAAVDRVMTISGDRVRAVALNITADAMTVETRSPLNSATDTFAVENNGRDITIGFNGQYL